MSDINKEFNDKIKQALDDHYLKSLERSPYWVSVDEYNKYNTLGKDGKPKRFRKTRDQVKRGLTTEQAFEEYVEVLRRKALEDN